MKTKITILLIAVLPLIFFGCQKNEVSEDIQTKQTPTGELKIQADLCGEATNFVFKNVPTGDEFGQGILGNNEVNLYVNFEAPLGWTIDKSVVYAGSVEDLESLTGGSINPQNFLYDDGTGYFNQGTWPEPIVVHNNGTTEAEYVFDYSLLPQPLPGECFIVVLAANFIDANGIIKGGYAYSSSLKSSGYYIDYCLEECVEPEPSCETVFAYGDQYAYCFREFNKKTGQYNPGGTANKNFSRWGWTNELEEGATYNFDIWAGAGKSDLSKGTLVGDLMIEYYGDNATVTYNMFSDYVLNETHLFIGETPIPLKNNGKPTLAPGQFPYSDNDATTVEDHLVVYEITDLPDDGIWVIAHGVTCGEYGDKENED